MSNLLQEAHEKYMAMAIDQGKKALGEGQFPAGCVLVADDQVVACGCRENSREDGGLPANELDHAEVIAVKRLLRKKPAVAPGQITLYSTMEPCLMCFATLLLNGVRTVVYAFEDVMGGGTNLNLGMLKPLYASMQVAIIPGVLRTEGLMLFYDFFSASQNNYLKDSLLARYTLEQGAQVRECK